MCEKRCKCAKFEACIRRAIGIDREADARLGRANPDGRDIKARYTIARRREECSRMAGRHRPKSSLTEGNIIAAHRPISQKEGWEAQLL